MADDTGRECIENYEPLKIEADQVVKEVAFAVKSVDISSKIPSRENEVYLNLRTMEGSVYCVELSVQGFRVVGLCFDTIDDNEHSQHFETIYSLLDSVSPGYRQTFGDALMKKLAMLERNSDEDEAMSQD
ncbi:hypothetical protein SNE40_019448 [Patella caerulea]|uniref:GSKIP domain-containing protein n=1 Tax=Patella caerulea TaxID=87958 RepID=A0AAN8PIR6_PATCE